MTELKPCPFCGGEAYIKEECDSFSCYSYVARCKKCLVEVRTDLDMTKDVNYNKERAIEAWNKRPNPWHTGTPSEGGRFLVCLKNGTYDIYEFGKEYKAWDIGFSDVLAWQKITPFEASKERE